METDNLSRVTINHSPDVQAEIWGALDLLDDIDELFRKKTVAIKPNDTWASSEDTTACTQADSVEAVIRYVKRYNPRQIVVTGGAGAAETEAVFSVLGIDKVIAREQVEFFDHNRPPFVRVELNSGPQKEVMVNPRVLEYDTLISLAQHKVHYEATVTLTMKNIAMSYPAADYYGHPRSAQLHPNRFYQDMHGFIVAMCQRFPIDLAIIVGHPAMVGQGPIGGTIFESELTSASRDFVAADSVGARILGINHVMHLEKAEKLGLGMASLGKIEIIGVPLNKAIQIFRSNLEAVSSPRRNRLARQYSHR